MSEDTIQPTDGRNPRPFTQTYEGTELPWDESAERYCGNFSQAFAGKVGLGPENTTANSIQLWGIIAAREAGTLTDLTVEDFSEFFRAMAESSLYMHGEQPRFWEALSSDEKRAALTRFTGDDQVKADTVMQEAISLLGQGLET